MEHFYFVSLWGAAPEKKLCCFSHLKRTEAADTSFVSVPALKECPAEKAAQGSEGGSADGVSRREPASALTATHGPAGHGTHTRDGRAPVSENTEKCTRNKAGTERSAERGRGRPGRKEAASADPRASSAAKGQALDTSAPSKAASVSSTFVRDH